MKGQGRLTPVEMFKRGVERRTHRNIIKLDEIHRPLPTTFRSTYPVPLPVEVVELARKLKSKYNQPVNEKLERVVKVQLVKMAHEVNRKMRKIEETLRKSVDSQQRPNQ